MGGWVWVGGWVGVGGWAWVCVCVCVGVGVCDVLEGVCDTCVAMHTHLNLSYTLLVRTLYFFSPSSIFLACVCLHKFESSSTGQHIYSTSFPPVQE